MKRIQVAAMALALIACGFFLSGCPKGGMNTMQNQDSSPKAQAYNG